jgi:threonyl-tRNA synthetase
MLIVGEKEEQSETVSVRKHGEGDLGTMSLEAFAGIVNDQISSQINLSIN